MLYKKKSIPHPRKQHKQKKVCPNRSISFRDNVGAILGGFGGPSGAKMDLFEPNIAINTLYMLFTSDTEQNKPKTTSLAQLEAEIRFLGPRGTLGAPQGLLGPPAVKSNCYNSQNHLFGS